MHTQKSRRSAPALLGIAAVACAVLGLLAWCGYATFAARGILAAATHDMETAHRMGSRAGEFSLAQMLLGILSIGLGGITRASSGGSRLASRLGTTAVCVGVVVLALLFLLV